MNKQYPQPWLTSEDSDITADSVAAEVTASASFREQLSQADVILLPYQEGEAGEEEVFVGGLRDLYHFIQSRNPTLRVEVATESDAPAELILHADWLDVGRLLIQYAALPLSIGTLANYVYHKLGADSRRQREVRVRCEIIVQRADAASIVFKYDGPAEHLVETVIEAVDGIR